MTVKPIKWYLIRVTPATAITGIRQITGRSILVDPTNSGGRTEGLLV